MKKIFLIALLLCNGQTLYAEDAAARKTLRDDAVLEGLSPLPDLKKWADTDPVPRNFLQQPPVIPHTTKGYVINLKFNKCLTCHSRENAGLSGATPVSETHYFNHDNESTRKIAGRRYFCVQCHVPQIDGDAWMSNDFKPAK